MSLYARWTMLDSNIVSEDTRALEITYGSGDGNTTVTNDLVLPIEGKNKSVISWTSSDPTLVSNTGVVTRSSYYIGEGSVILTATIVSGSVLETKEFSLTIKSLDPTDEDYVKIDRDALGFEDFIFTSSDTPTSVKSDFNVPRQGVNDTNITWSIISGETFNIQIESNKIKVHRPYGNDDNDATVTIRATISKGAATPETKDFTLTVLDLLEISSSLYGNRLAVIQSTGDIFYLEGRSSNEVNGVLTLKDTDNEWKRLTTSNLPTGAGTANYGSSLAVAPDGTIYVLTSVKVPNQNYYSTKVYALADGATSWTPLEGSTALPNKPGGMGSTGKIVVDSNGKPYAMAGSGFGFVVYEWVNDTWADITPITMRTKSDIFVDGDTLYCVTGTPSHEGFVVYKRSSGEWTQLDSGLAITGDANKYPSISASGNLVTLAVVQADKTVKVMHYNGTNWTELSNLEPKVQVGQGTNAYMQTITVGSTSYLVAYMGNNSTKGTVTRYDSGGWTEMYSFWKDRNASLHAVYDSFSNRILVLDSNKAYNLLYEVML